MSTAISWTDDTWNPIRGCSPVSEGCRHCYAKQQAARINRMSAAAGRPSPYDGLVTIVKRDVRQMQLHNGKPTGQMRTISRDEARWTGKVVFDPKKLADPLRWRKPRRVFVNSMSDLFHEAITNEQIAAVFGVMAACPQHTFQILTKRPQRMREWFAWTIDDNIVTSGFYDVTYLNHLASKAGVVGNRWRAHCDETEDTVSSWPLPNVHLGVSVENQAAADERIPDLLACPAEVHWISAEPLLGPLNIEKMVWQESAQGFDWSSGEPMGQEFEGRKGIWVVTGCESGPGARPCDVAWLRSLRDQCAAAAGVPFFLKQAEEEDGCADCGDILLDNEDGDPTCSCCGRPGERPSITLGSGSKRKAGGVIELPYLDGVQWRSFPEVKP